MPSTSNTILKLTKLTKQVSSMPSDTGEQQDHTIDILKGVDLEIKYGESLAIMGASGSGKSTLLGLMAGLDRSTGGELYLDNQRLTLLDEDQRAMLRARLLGFVFQSFQLLPGLTALQNVMLPLELQSSKQAKELSLHMLERVGLAHRLHHYPQQLSGGEQQRVAIARAFITQPKLVFADEPTGNLDKKTGQQIIDLLFKINQELNTTLVIVTHDESLASRCDRSLLLENGILQDV